VNFSSLIESYEILLGLLGAAAFIFLGKNRILIAAMLALPIYSTFLNALIDAKSARHRAILIPVLAICLMKGVEVILGRFRGDDRTTELSNQADAGLQWSPS